MKRVKLPGTFLTTSVVGFGCAGLTGVLPAKERLQLLEAAFDGGVRHFDTARYYGYGEAERVLGKFLRVRRAQVTVTTKFGIQPPARLATFSGPLNVARRLARLSPGLRRVLSSQAGKIVKTGAFSVAEARASLEMSLRELHTDYIDIYLLHEASLEDTRSEGLLEFLEGTIRQGKIRYFGIGTEMRHVLAIVDGNPAFAKVVQFENSLLKQNLRFLPWEKSRAVITHRPLHQSYRHFQFFLSTDLRAVTRWSEKLGVDCRSEIVLANLLLKYAVQANPCGVVLFSTCSRQHLDANLKAVSESPLSTEQVTELEGLASELPPMD